LIDLSKTKLSDKTASTFKQLGARLYVNHHNTETYCNQIYWRDLPEVAKLALNLIYISIEKENKNNG
jgi:hypothetical protein